LAETASSDCEQGIHKIALLAQYIKAERGAWWAVANAPEVRMADVARTKPRYGAFLQPEEEFPL